LREDPLAYRIIGQTPDGKPLMRSLNEMQQQHLVEHQEEPIQQAKPVEPEEIVLPPKKAEPKKADPIPVTDASPDMDALIRAMAPKPRA